MIKNVNRKPNIIIVDDHLIFRQGLKSIINSENIANVIGEASNGIEFLDLLSHIKPDLVLMDIDMPHMNGLDATQKALEILPDLKIIAFTMFGEEDYYLKMIERGVKGFILKTSGLCDLENAINDIMAGGCYFSNEHLRKIINNFSQQKTIEQAKNETITMREKEILQQICIGLTNEEIAQKLFISPKTVKSHRSNIMKKTGFKNTPKLILYAIKCKIIEI